MSQDDIVSVVNLTKSFRVGGAAGSGRDLLAVDDVTFSVPAGGSVAIVGESGSGKTTTARIIAGLESRSSGSISFRGKASSTPKSVAERRAHARQVQMVFQDPYGSLDPRQTLGGALDEILVVHNGDRRARWRTDRAEELMGLVGLDSSHLAKLPRALSGGQRQRFAIGRALAVGPELLILDEAVSALDVSVQAQVLNLLIDLRARTGVSYLFVSHDLAVVRQISDSVLVMKDGRVVESGPTDEVMDRPRSDYARKLLAAIPRPAWEPV